MPTRDVFENLSALDFRYHDPTLVPYLSEEAFTRYKLKVEVALVETLCKRDRCSQATVDEIRAACDKVTTQEVYEEENRTKHDIRALVNCIQRRVSDTAKPFVHMTATSYDIVETANAARIRDVTMDVVIPRLLILEELLIEITLGEANTLQVGRTHGQHAVPITFGFAMAEYVDRLGSSIQRLDEMIRLKRLPGKFSGAVGAYNASSLFFEDPEAFEYDVLDALGLRAGGHSTQICQPEPMIRYFTEIGLAAGILGNLARDMRHLQRTEIAEVGEAFDADQVGSSTMPQKRNPISFENIESMWKIVISRITLLFMDQVSEHQRDLTGSASGRTYIETICYLAYMAKRLRGTMSKLHVDRASLERNFALQQGLIAAEPLYIMLASIGHPDAHEAVRQLTLRAQAERRPLETVAQTNDDLMPWIDKLTPTQRGILSNPSQYTGIAADKARQVANRWKKHFGF